MHIPDGFLDTKTWVATAAASAAAVGFSLRRAGSELGERSVPLLGVTAAAIFAAQMINVPIIGGTSGHVIGAALAAKLLGPWAATVVMTTVLAVQALFFQDGGLTALGANILNMAILAVWSAHLVHVVFRRSEHNRPLHLAGTFLAGWVSVMVSALAASVELVLSGIVRFAVVAPAMLFFHAFIGLIEGLITAAVLEYMVTRRSAGSGARRTGEEAA